MCGWSGRPVIFRRRVSAGRPTLCARTFCDTSFTWYNHEHHQTGIGLYTPAAVHYGHADAATVARQEVLDTWTQNPERFTHRPQPKSPRRADTAWINKPETAAHQPEAMTLAA